MAPAAGSQGAWEGLPTGPGNECSDAPANGDGKGTPDGRFFDTETEQKTGAAGARAGQTSSSDPAMCGSVGGEHSGSLPDHIAEGAASEPKFFPGGPVASAAQEDAATRTDLPTQKQTGSGSPEQARADGGVASPDRGAGAAARGDGTVRGGYGARLSK